MSVLIGHCIDLLPQPQQMIVTQPRWQNDPAWHAFNPEREGIALAWAANQEEAQRLVDRLALPENPGREAYDAVFAPEGIAVRARHPEGITRFDSLAAQMRQLALEEEGVPCIQVRDWPDMEVRGIHLDLKYFMHRIDYLTHEWLPELHRCRINTLLLEYEDKFPFSRYPELVAPGAFTPEELRTFLAKARGLGIRVVPLFQTLGHWEFILRHERFRPLRGGAAGEYHTEVRPNDPEALKLIFELIDEILAYHDGDDWFHAGGDEPWFLRKKYGDAPETLGATFGRHMRAVCGYLISKGKRPLIYDDVFRDHPHEAIRAALNELPPQTILCFWDYRGTMGWPGPRALEALRLYRERGFDVLGLPCHNWGSLVPYYQGHTLRNTQEMIRLSREIGALGVINTAWACFRVALPFSSFGIAVTGARTWKAAASPDLLDVETAFSRLWFGLKDRRIVSALYQIGIQLEFASSFGRPLNLPHFYYMDAVIQYGGHEMREKLGSSLDLYGNADCRYIVSRKLEIVRRSRQYPNAIEALHKFCNLAYSAEAMLDSLEDQVTTGRPLFELMRWAARFKQFAGRRMLALLGNHGAEPEAFRAEGQALREAFATHARWFLIEGEIRREQGYLFEGETALLGEAVNVSPA